MCITLKVLCVWLSLSLFLKPGWQDKSLSLFYCCSTNPFTQRCSTVSATRSHVDPSAQNCTICKHVALNLHCRISPLKVQHKKKRIKEEAEHSEQISTDEFLPHSPES
ncbi:hypothetical protein ILYODFUR_014279 [Ilyodon furcidens]|uniref:Secreted protein n=1 Tax=Ilyodon furcidens TaxID=33524 RepID=A0ABV0UVC2_9TELE